MSARFGGDPVGYVHDALRIPVESRDERTTGLLAKYLFELVEATALVEAGRSLTVGRRKLVAKAFRFLAHLGVPRDTAMRRLPVFRALLDADGEDSVIASYERARQAAWVMPVVDMTAAETRAALGMVASRLMRPSRAPARSPGRGPVDSAARDSGSSRSREPYGGAGRDAGDRSGRVGSGGTHGRDAGSDRDADDRSGRDRSGSAHSRDTNDSAPRGSRGTRSRVPYDAGRGRSGSSHSRDTDSSAHSRGSHVGERRERSWSTHSRGTDDSGRYRGGDSMRGSPDFRDADDSATRGSARSPGGGVARDESGRSRGSDSIRDRDVRAFRDPYGRAVGEQSGLRRGDADAGSVRGGGAGGDKRSRISSSGSATRDAERSRDRGDGDKRHEPGRNSSSGSSTRDAERSRSRGDGESRHVPSRNSNSGSATRDDSRRSRDRGDGDDRRGPGRYRSGDSATRDDPGRTRDRGTVGGEGRGHTRSGGHDGGTADNRAAAVRGHGARSERARPRDPGSDYGEPPVKRARSVGMPADVGGAAAAATGMQRAVASSLGARPGGYLTKQERRERLDADDSGSGSSDSELVDDGEPGDLSAGPREVAAEAGGARSSPVANSASITDSTKQERRERLDADDSDSGSSDGDLVDDGEPGDLSAGPCEVAAEAGGARSSPVATSASVRGGALGAAALAECAAVPGAGIGHETAAETRERGARGAATPTTGLVQPVVAPGDPDPSPARGRVDVPCAAVAGGPRGVREVVVLDNGGDVPPDSLFVRTGRLVGAEVLDSDAASFVRNGVLSGDAIDVFTGMFGAAPWRRIPTHYVLDRTICRALQDGAPAFRHHMRNSSDRRIRLLCARLRAADAVVIQWNVRDEHWAGCVILRPELHAVGGANRFFWADSWGDQIHGEGFRADHESPFTCMLMRSAADTLATWAAARIRGWVAGLQVGAVRVRHSASQTGGLWEFDANACGIFVAAFVCHVTTLVPADWGDCVPPFHSDSRRRAASFMGISERASGFGRRLVSEAAAGGMEPLWHQERRLCPPLPRPGEHGAIAQRLWSTGHADGGVAFVGLEARKLAAAIVAVTEGPVLEFVGLALAKAPGALVDDVSGARSMDLSVVAKLLNDYGCLTWMPDGDSTTWRLLQLVTGDDAPGSRRVRTRRPQRARNVSERLRDRARLFAYIRLSRFHGDLQNCRAAVTTALRSNGLGVFNVEGEEVGDAEWAAALLSEDGVDCAVTAAFQRMGLAPLTFMEAVRTISDAVDSWAERMGDPVASVVGLEPFTGRASCPLLWWGPSSETSVRQPVHMEEDPRDNAAREGSWGGRASAYGPSAIFMGAAFETVPEGALCINTDSTHFYLPYPDTSTERDVRAFSSNPMALRRDIAMCTDMRVRPFAVRYGHSKAWHSGGPSSVAGNSRFVIHCATGTEVSQAFPWSVLRGERIDDPGKVSDLDLFTALAGDPHWDRRGTRDLPLTDVRTFVRGFEERRRDDADRALREQRLLSLALPLTAGGIPAIAIPATSPMHAASAGGSASPAPARVGAGAICGPPLGGGSHPVWGFGLDGYSCVLERVASLLGCAKVLAGLSRVCRAFRRLMRDVPVDVSVLPPLCTADSVEVPWLRWRRASTRELIDALWDCGCPTSWQEPSVVGSPFAFYVLLMAHRGRVAAVGALLRDAWDHYVGRDAREARAVLLRAREAKLARLRVGGRPTPALQRASADVLTRYQRERYAQEAALYGGLRRLAEMLLSAYEDNNRLVVFIARALRSLVQDVMAEAVTAGWSPAAEDCCAWIADRVEAILGPAPLEPVERATWRGRRPGTTTPLPLPLGRAGEPGS